jgi:hypothetical protein
MDAWTGTQADGTAVSGAALGQWNSTLTVGPAIGCGFFVNSSWLDAETYSSSQGGNTQALSLYALSSVITVPAPVPEPSTFALLPSVAVSLLAYAWRRRTLTA